MTIFFMQHHMYNTYCTYSTYIFYLLEKLSVLGARSGIQFVFYKENVE